MTGRSEVPAIDARSARRLGVFLGVALASAAGLTMVARGAPDVGRPVGLSVKDLPDQPMGSHILAREGTELAYLYGDINRTPVELNEVAPIMQRTTVAAEDKRFFNHSGVDLRGAFRAAAANIGSGAVKQGGSTLTQQYVRNTFLSQRRTISRKVEEISISIAVEQTHTKQEILEAYLNTAYFGEGAYGVEAAAKTYFGIHASELTPPQAALLVGLLPSPNEYSPDNNPRLATKRRNQILKEMLEASLITSEEFTTMTEQPLDIIKRETQVIKMAPHFVEFVKRRLLKDPRMGATPADRYAALFRGGLTIRTTLDPRLQQVADDAAKRLLPRSIPEASVVLMDTHKGDLLAYHGGKDFGASSFDLVSQAHRQPGSAFKVFALVAALKARFSPDTIINGGSPCIFQLSRYNRWTVHNFDGEQFGPISLRASLVHSVNCVFANLVTRYVSANDVKDAASSLGITSELDANPAIAIGGIRVGVNTLEMARAFGTLAADGKRPKVRPILEVRDRHGKLVLSDEPESEEVLSPNTARAAVDVMRGVVTGGTGAGANFGRPAAGKTGTSQKHRDAWFVGFTPQYVAAVWIGHPKGLISMSRVTGGSVPASIWKAVMVAAHKDVPVKGFPLASWAEFNRYDPVTNAIPVIQPSPSPSPEPSPSLEPSPQPSDSPTPLPPTPSPSPSPPGPTPSPTESPTSPGP